MCGVVSEGPDGPQTYICVQHDCPGYYHRFITIRDEDDA